MQRMDEQLYDIYTQWHVPFWQKNMFWLTFGLCLAVLVSMLIWRFIICRIRKKSTVPYPVIARNSIKKLNASKYAYPQHAAVFYAMLIDILKKYLTAHYSRDFVSKTDQECLDVLMSVAHNKQICDTVGRVLNGSLTVRFAQARVVEQMIHDDVSRALQIITITQSQNMPE